MFLIAVGTVVSAVIALGLSGVVEPLSASLTWVGVFFLMTSAIMAIAELLYGRVRKTPEPVEARPAQDRVHRPAPGTRRASRAVPVRFDDLGGCDVRPRARRGRPVLVPAGHPHHHARVRRRTCSNSPATASGCPTPLASVVGFVAAGLTGYLAIWWLLPFLKRHRLWWFVGYTAILGSVVLALGVTGRG